MVESRADREPTNPLNLIERLNLPQRRLEWAFKAWDKRFLKEEHLQSKKVFLERFNFFLTALHEVGHKIAGKAAGLNFLGISLIPEGNSLARTRFSGVRLNTSRNIRGWISTCYGGRLVVELYGETSYGYGSDMSQAQFAAELAKGADLGNPASDAARSITGYGINNAEDKAFALAA